MRTPEEFFAEIDNPQLTVEQVIEKIADYRTEVWNEAVLAVEEAANNLFIESEPEVGGDAVEEVIM